MPAAVALTAVHVDLVADYYAAMRAAGRSTGRSTMQAARTFCAKLERASGWEQMSSARQLDAIRKARSFASWLMVTGQLTVDADVFGRVYLRLGTAARTFCPDTHAWFVEACEQIGVRDGDIATQWNSLAMITAVTGVAADRVGDHHFDVASRAVIDAYMARDQPESGRNMASIFHRLRLTLFHAGKLDNHRRPRVARRCRSPVGRCRSRLRGGRPPLRRTGHPQPPPGDGQAHRAAPARVRHLAGRAPPRGGQLR